MLHKTQTGSNFNPVFLLCSMLRSPVAIFPLFTHHILNTLSKSVITRTQRVFFVLPSAELAHTQR